MKSDFLVALTPCQLFVLFYSSSLFLEEMTNMNQPFTVFTSRFNRLKSQRYKWLPYAGNPPFAFKISVINELDVTWGHTLRRYFRPAVNRQHNVSPHLWKTCQSRRRSAAWRSRWWSRRPDRWRSRRGGSLENTKTDYCCQSSVFICMAISLTQEVLLNNVAKVNVQWVCSRKPIQAFVL